MYHKYSTQDINSRLCGTYCSEFFDLIEGMKYYDAVLNIHFD